VPQPCNLKCVSCAHSAARADGAGGCAFSCRLLATSEVSVRSPACQPSVDLRRWVKPKAAVRCTMGGWGSPHYPDLLAVLNPNMRDFPPLLALQVQMLPPTCSRLPAPAQTPPRYLLPSKALAWCMLHSVLSLKPRVLCSQ